MCICKPSPVPLVTPPHTRADLVPSPGAGRTDHLQPLSVKYPFFSHLHESAYGVRFADVRVGSHPHQDLPGASPNSPPQPRLGANIHGVISPVIQPLTAIRKRAFIRAQNRARNHGTAKYQGRWYSPEALGVVYTPKPPKQPNQAKPRRRRLTYLSWNAGGLHSARNAELKTWLEGPEGEGVNLVAIQETHWKGPLEYSTARFHAIHSGGSKSEAGLLLLVDNRVFPSANVQHRDLLPGRLLHVRLEAEPCIDVLIGYQHTWIAPKAGTPQQCNHESLLSRRAEYWATLSACLSSLPKRNQLLLLADLNTDVLPESMHVGRGVFTRAAQHATDQQALQDIIRQHQLIVLNSWGPRGRRACTHLSAGQGGHSQIDFAISRLHNLDQLARAVHPKPLPFVPVVGLRHLPLQGSLPYPNVPRTKPPPSTLLKHRVLATCHNQPQALSRYQVHLAALHELQPDLPTNALIVKAWGLATSRLTEPLGRALREPDAHPIRRVWTLRKEVRLLRLKRDQGLRVLLKLWRTTVVLIKQAQKELQHKCKQARRRRIDTLLQEVAQCPNNLTAVSRIARALAPAAPRRKLQLRSSEGMPLSTSEAMQRIKTYFYSIYNQHQSNCNLQPPSQPLQLTFEEFSSALGQLPASKALPGRVPPAVL